MFLTIPSEGVFFAGDFHLPSSRCRFFFLLPSFVSSFFRSSSFLAAHRRREREKIGEGEIEGGGRRREDSVKMKKLLKVSSGLLVRNKARRIDGRSAMNGRASRWCLSVADLGRRGRRCF